MDKKLFQAVLLIVVFLMGWQMLMSKRHIKPQQQVVQEVTSGIPQPIQEQEQEQGKIVVAEPESLSQVQIGEYIVTYSDRGGYINSLSTVSSGDVLEFKNIGFIPQDQDKDFTSDIKKNKIIFKARGNITKEFIFDGFSVAIKLSSPPPSMILFSNHLSTNRLDQRYQEFFYARDDTIQRMNPGKVSDSTYSNIDFAGARDRYYCASLIKGSYDKISWAKNMSADQKTIVLSLLSPSSETTLYIGPQKEQEMDEFGIGGIVYYGFFHWIALGLIKLLYIFHAVTRSWGISVILFSIVAYVVLLPLTLKSTKGMKEMRDFQKTENS